MGFVFLSTLFFSLVKAFTDTWNILVVEPNFVFLKKCCFFFWNKICLYKYMYFHSLIRSRSLLKSRRISGRLYEIRVHPIQSLHSSSSQSAGKATKEYCQEKSNALLSSSHLFIIGFVINMTYFFFHCRPSFAIPRQY